MLNRGEEPGIAAIATAVGEEELDAAAFAEACGTSLEVVKRWIGSMKIFTTRKSATELAAVAALACLARAACSPEDVDAILWCSASGLPDGARSELHVQKLLGAKRAFAIAMGDQCAELPTALWMAQAMVGAWPGVHRVLVVSGEIWAPARTLRGLSSKVRFQPVFSDVAAAALISPGATTRLISIGSATSGDRWDNFQRIAQHGEQGFKALTSGMVEASRLDATALRRCLTGTGIEPADIQHYILTRESPEVVQGIVRRMGLDVARVLQLSSGPSHGGSSDGLFGLEALLYGRRGASNENVLMCARTLGIARFGLFRLGELPAPAASS